MKKQDEAYDSILKLWNDSQRKMLDVWSEWLNTNAGSMSEMLEGKYNPMRLPDELKISGVSALGDKTAADYMVGQSALNELIELSLGVWKEVLSRESKSENWTEMVQNFTNQWIENSHKGLLDLGEERDSNPHLWKTFLGQLPVLSLALFGMPSTASDAVERDFGHHIWLTLQDGWNSLPQLAGEAAELPHVGTVDTTVGRKILQGYEAWYVFVTTGHKLQALRLEAWNEIAMRVSRRLSDFSQTGEPITTSRDWLLLWVEVGDEVLIDMYRSENYLKIQRELMAATMNYKKWLQEFGDLILKAYGCPTRTELDDAYRSIHELRRELRTLKKDLRPLVAAGKSKAGATPRRKKSVRGAAKSSAPKS